MKKFNLKLIGIFRLVMLIILTGLTIVGMILTSSLFSAISVAIIGAGCITVVDTSLEDSMRSER